MREPLKKYLKGSQRIRFVLQKSLIEKTQDLVIAQIGKMGKEKFRTILRFLTGLIIPPFTDTENTGQSAGLE